MSELTWNESTITRTKPDSPITVKDLSEAKKGK